jgi:signal transduction histidine kinase
MLVTRAKALTFRTVATIASFVVGVVFSLAQSTPSMTKLGNLGLSVLGAACVWASTQYPRASLVAVCGLCAGAPALTGSFASLELVVVFVLYQATISSELNLWVLATVGLGALGANEAWRRTTVSEPMMSASTLYPFVLTAFAIGLGWQGRQLRRANRELVELRDTDRELARLDERRMIARDLHDVAAHHLSALVVRNKLARRVGTDEALQAASDFTATTAGEALDALRQVVGVLSDRRDGNSTEAPVVPQPTLSDLEGIFTRLEGAGLRIHRDAPAVPALRRDIELAVLRITQEALTNVLRHRGPGNAWFQLTTAANEVIFTVDDDGGQTATGPRTHEGGHGLIGMRERAEACGGQLNIARSTHGGWQIAAKLPLHAP